MDGERQRWPAMRETAGEKWDPAAAARTRKLRRSASNGREARRGGGGSGGKFGCWMRLPALAKVKVIGRAPELSLDTPRSSCTLDKGRNDGRRGCKKAKDGGGGGAVLVTVDGDVELEMKTLLKASAYILGAAGSSIVYMAVLDDGAVLAVRRIGSDDASPAAWREGWPSSTTRSSCGNVRPSNILLDANMEPLLADIGIHRLIRGGGTLKPAAAAVLGRFGSKRSAKCSPDLSPPGARLLAGPSGSGDTVAQY
ncbi:hypothetical protein OsJ_00829 [Oryza sativa Japonica Group]|uniref:Protein kinase domain-containing protein n=1 Tax=Oryza sativa subsp. japonica TaxID=39947 RepID=B9EU07_ORYSJ|nr:hypothetical protein OsJ_00829 [Oryza sativa Japonica Group]